MRLTVDLDTLQLIASATDRRRVTMVEFKRGDSTPIELQFVRAGVAEALATGAVITLAMKESGKYDADFVVEFSDFAEPTATPNFLYVGTPSLATTELDDLLFKDSDEDNDVASVDLMGEITWEDDSNPASVRTFVARVHNDVVRGDESLPVSSGSKVIHVSPTITGLTGGGSTKLDGIATVEKTAGYLQGVIVGGYLHQYQLTAGTTAESSPVTIRPDDYNGSTNAKYWMLLSLRATFVTANELTTTLLNIEGGSFVASVESNLLTNDRALELPDKAGTLAVLPNVFTEPTTARTISPDPDAGSYIRLTNASSCTITVPPNADAAFEIGTEIYFRIAAAGIPTITEGAGVTVNNKTALASLATHATWALKKVDTNVWDLI